MSARGFTLVELLVATTVLLLVSASAFTLVRPVRAAFDLQPAAIDIRQRGRAGLEVLGHLVRNAGGGDAAGGAGRRMASLMPVVWPLTSLDEDDQGDTFHALLAIAPVAGGGRGRLAIDQASPGSPLTLDEEGCPAIATLCGFSSGAVVAIFDARGRFDIFEAGSVAAATRRMMAEAPLARAYAAGAWLVEVEAARLGLRSEADGSRTLVRVTWAGAVEPIVDGVVSLDVFASGAAAPPFVAESEDGESFASYGPPPAEVGQPDPDGAWPDGEHCAVMRDEAGARSRLHAWGGLETRTGVRPADLRDGPWCPLESAPGAYDADIFRLTHIDLVLRLEASSARLRGPAGPLFARGGHADPSRWLPDRELVFSVALR